MKAASHGPSSGEAPQYRGPTRMGLAISHEAGNRYRAGIGCGANLEAPERLDRD